MLLSSLFVSKFAFWLLLLGMIVLFVLNIIQAYRKSDSDFQIISGIVMAAMMLFLFISMSQSKSDSWRNDIINEISQINNEDENMYYDVEFLGKKNSIFNRADARWYVDMGSNSMVSYNRIIASHMCRRCDQFKEGSMYDTLYVYRVQESEPHWWNSGPYLVFSKYRDIFLEASKPIELEKKN